VMFEGEGDFIRHTWCWDGLVLSYFVRQTPAATRALASLQALTEDMAAGDGRLFFPFQGEQLLGLVLFWGPARVTSLKPTGCTWSYLSCIIGHLVPIDSH
jgi:hypothetical protein